jgi:fructosamine-3-kinase
MADWRALDFFRDHPILHANKIASGKSAEVWRVEIKNVSCALKISKEKHFNAVLEAEIHGLKRLQQAIPDHIPYVYTTGTWDTKKYLITRFIPGQQAASRHSAHSIVPVLLHLHAYSQPEFGLDRDNYIGILPQTNALCRDGSSFYKLRRLQPMLERLRDVRWIPGEDRKYLDWIMQQDLPLDQTPSLVHGDLWGGNICFDRDGKPVLLDPSVSYAHPQTDIAMGMLFGGISREEAQLYKRETSADATFDLVVSLYQLYYLLVHVILFGKSYWPEVFTLTRDIRRQIA